MATVFEGGRRASPFSTPISATTSVEDTYEVCPEWPPPAPVAPNLARIVEAWDKLLAHIRAATLALTYQGTPEEGKACLFSGLSVS